MNQCTRKNNKVARIRLSAPIVTEIETQVDQIPLDCPESAPSTTTITCPVVNHSQSRLQGRKVSFTPASIIDQSNKIMQNQPSEVTNQDMSIKIYVKELSRLIGPSVKIPSMYNKQSNNGTTPKYSVTSSIAKMNPLVMCPSKVNIIGNTNNFITDAFDKNKKLQQSQAMTLFSNVGTYVDRDCSGRFDDWLAHLESVLVLGDFEESRKIILLRSKLYGEAAYEFDNFKLENPISAQIYDGVKERLMKLFYSTQTRSKQSVFFHNMQRESEENMRRYTNRIRKVFHLVYPIKSTIDKATAFSREQIMMDRFLEGMSFDVQTRLKYKEFETFEKLIEKAEMTAMAVEETQVRRKHGKMQRQLSTRRNVSFSQRSPQSNPPINQTRDLYFCDFNNDWGYHSISNCKAMESQANDKCFRCKEIRHRANFCSQIKDLKPSPPEGYDGNGKKLTLFEEMGNLKLPIEMDYFFDLFLCSLSGHMATRRTFFV
ncbi:Uncharacterized protein APZ42_027748 [Daphnia magna]|uniref:Uncharacterized protein n=1 Tax=Daphnia magna TaxID=35525 RepID=A0A164R2L2_9CRUS|nr:Uncharacterized protein APZ42_027748 [Daphnia magna]